MDNKIDINNFLRKYNEEYNFLYENNDNVAGYDEAVQWFDTMYASNEDFKNFVRKVAIERGDAFSSDRECVAFAFACDSLNLF